jgi:hypothetical protein
MIIEVAVYYSPPVLVIITNQVPLFFLLIYDYIFHLDRWKSTTEGGTLESRIKDNV